MPNKVEIVLDATMLDMLQLCPERFNFRFNKRRIAPTKAKALDRGSLIHNAFEAYYLALKASKPFEQRMQLMLARADLYYATESNLDPEDAGFAKEILIENVTHWRERDERMTVKAIEQPFAYILFEDESIRVVMIGKIDLICDYDDGRSTYRDVPFDHKSYEKEYPARRLNNQFINYTLATGSNFLFVNKVGFQKINTSKPIPPEEKHKRVILTFDDKFFAQWKANVVAVVRDYITYEAENSYPMNLTSCDKFNRICEYYEVCNSSGVEAKFWKLASDFDDTPVWDVSQSLGAKAEK